MEKTVLATNVTSKLKQTMYMHATKINKASEFRNKPFKVEEFLMYEQLDKEDKKVFLILKTIDPDTGNMAVIATNSIVMIETFSDIVSNLDDGVSITDLTFRINEGKTKNGRSYNLLEFWI